MTTKLEGIIAATVTPFDSEEGFAEAAYEALLARLYAAGVDGVYVCGQTGEGLLQTVEQRKQVAATAMRVSPADKQVIVHVGAFRTADAVELARHAGSLGVTAISALPPLGAYRFAEVRDYYAAISEAATAPLLVYYFPESFPAVQTPEQVLELYNLPNVAGLKYTDFDLYRMRNIKQSGATIFNGRDEVLAAGLLFGADGGIGTFYNVVPEWFVELYRWARAGDWTRAMAMQDKINAVIRATLQYPVFPAIKQILAWSGIDCGPCMRPRGGLTSEQAEGLRRDLEPCAIPVLRP